MPPTRKISRSKQQSESTDNETIGLDEKIESISDRNAVTSSKNTDKNDNKSLSDEPTDCNQDDSISKSRRGRTRRSTATSTQLNNDLNNETYEDSTLSPPLTRTGSKSASPEKKESDIKLRRRDKLRGTDRYSPEIHEPVRRSSKRSSTATSFPSTSNSQNKYINFEGFDDEQSFTSQTSVNSSPQLLHTKKMLLKRSASTMLEDQNNSATNESKTYLVNLKKEENEVILVMPDGRTLKIEKQMQKKMKTGKNNATDEDYEVSSDDAAAAEDDDNDLDYEEEGKTTTRSTKRKSITANKNTRSTKTSKLMDSSNHDSDDHVPASSKAQATGIKMTKQIRRATKQQLMSNKLGDETRTTRITTPTGSGKTVTFITTPKSVTVTPTNTYLKNSNNTYVKRNYGSNAKYLNEIPDLNECTLEEVNPDYEILPDSILLINSDLPLEHSLNTDYKDRKFLFTQIISNMGDFKCLLCTKTSTFKDENELVEHYKHIHEVEVEQQNAKFSEDTVFVCLPKSIIGQIDDEKTSSNLILDAPCQYCGDEQKLATVTDMKEHYKATHSKEIKIVEQEEILEMYEVLFCSICQVLSKDFKLHYKHMKDEHQLQTYICKQCPFFSKVPQRLVTHYRAKHLMSNKSQNLQCSFCNGILIGTDRMNKHIMTSHCVQTGQNEYSCMLCLQPCEKSDQLLAHSYQCQRKYNEALALTHKQEKIPAAEQARLIEQQAIDEANAIALEEEEEKFNCFFCDKTFNSEEMCNLHLNHVHTKWTSTVVVNDTFLMVQHKDGKTDLMPNNAGNKNNELEQININDLPTNKEVEEIGAKTQYGYYCSKCECVIKIYQLFYLHMHNFHKMTKQFECKITSCKKTFKTHESFKKHIEQTNHPQKSVIEDPLLSIACHNCDSYFINNKDIETHLLSDEHYNRVIKSADRSGMKSEARNYKCKTCHTWFGLLDSFIYHMENESHKHGCPHCGLHFALPSSRRTHIQSIHSDRADICELCSEKQGTKERLFAHLVTHNLVFECNKCMRKFYQREQLNNHMETHGEPLDCPWPKCERKVNRTALSNHIRQHKVETSLKCYACDKLFQTKSQLSAHVEVHNTAEQNAKQILATASKIGKVGQINSNIIQKPKTGQIQLNTHSSGNSQSVETTLISITTASGANKQRTYGNRSLSNSANKVNNVNNIKPQTPSNRYQIEKGNSNTANSKLICFTCNQLFANHSELSEHKCSIPVVTITKEISNMLNNKQIDLSDSVNQNDLQQLIFTAEKLNGNESQQCFIMTDGSIQDASGSFKHVIIQQPLSNLDDKNKRKIITPAVPSSSHNRFMESNKKTYDFQNRAKKTYSLKNKTPTTSNQVIATNQQQLLNATDSITSKSTDNQQIFIETQSPINQQTQLILTDSNQLASLNSGNIELDSNTVSTIQALIQDNQLIQTGTNNEVLQIPIDQNSIIMQDQQIVVSTTSSTSSPVNISVPSTLVDQTAVTQTTNSNEQAQTVEQQITADTSQYIMIQQPDGQCVQICIPEGMDVDEVIKNLNFTWQSSDEQTVQTADDDQETAQFLDNQQILEQQQMIADQQNQMIAAEQQQLIEQPLSLDQNTVEQLQSGEQQVIYLPVNEEGVCSLDPESLAMLTGEIPIIVSSSN